MRTKLLLALLALLAGTVPASAYYLVDGLAYNITGEETVSVVNPSYSNIEIKGDVVIPTSVNIKGKTYTVTVITKYAFENRTGLTSVTIPSSIIDLDDNAFYGCSNLTTVLWNAKSCSDLDSRDRPFSKTGIQTFIFGDEVEKIPAYLCYGKTGLKSVSFGSSVTSIGEEAFCGCTSLSSINLPNSVTSIGDMVFYGCTSLNSINLPNSVNSIGRRAFENTLWLDNQPDGLVYAGLVAYNYKGTSPIKSTFKINDGTTGIASECFEYCTNLTSITIPNSVITIGNYAFNGCTGLRNINNPYPSISSSATIPASVTSIGNGAFSGCTGLTNVTIPNSVTSIGNGAFSGCTGLTNVTIPNSVTKIGEGAFTDCAGLRNVKLPNSITLIDAWTFSNCSSLTNVTIPNSVTKIGYSAFIDCSNLRSMTLPNSVKFIIENAFAFCTGLTNITIPNSVTSIGMGAFKGCNGLKRVNITDLAAWCNIHFGIQEGENWIYSYSGDSDGNPLSYAKHLYMNDKEVTNLVIPEGVDVINNYAFYGCSGLTSVTIPNSVTTIGGYAFAYCTGLTRIEAYPDPAKVSMGLSVFYNVPKAGTLHVLPRYLSAYQTADQWKEFTNIKGDLADVLQGDSDGNGVVNGSDVTTLYNFLLNGVEPSGDLDVDGNGVVNGSDVTTLYNILLAQ